MSSNSPKAPTQRNESPPLRLLFCSYRCGWHAHREWRLQYARHTARVRNALYSTACCARQPLHPPPPHESNRMQHEARRRLQTPPVPCAQHHKRFFIFEFHKTKSAKSWHGLTPPQLCAPRRQIQNRLFCRVSQRVPQANAFFVQSFKT
jgi:hypothetical protein